MKIKKTKKVSKLAGTYSCFLSSLMWCKNKFSNSFTENENPIYIRFLSLVLFAFCPYVVKDNFHWIDEIYEKKCYFLLIRKS